MNAGLLNDIIFPGKLIMIKDILILIRPRQYIKNLFVFAPLFFSFRFTELDKAAITLIIFASFCMVSSAVYVINDILDVKEDQAHPVKKNRPIANGKISPGLAWVIMACFLLPALFVSAVVSIQVLLIIAIYFLLNVLYSIKLKHIPIVDIVIISIGFLLRIIAGGVGAGIELSMWIIIITFLLSVFLALAKRRDDVLLIRQGFHVRKNIDGYNLEFINAATIVMASVIIVSYILYTVSLDIQNKFGTNKLYVTAIFVVIGLLRYLQITLVDEKSGNPTEILWSDRFLQLIILMWLGSFYLIVKL